jgi:SAM-dependent methyltransferase
MLQLRERIDLSSSQLEFRFKSRLLQSLLGSLPFYFIRRALYRHTPVRQMMTRCNSLNERVAEYPYIFSQLSRYPGIKSVLDIGSAFSLLPIQLATLGYQVTGLDIIDSGDTYHPNFVQIVSDLFDNKLPDNSFDAVVSVSTIEHMGFGVFGDKVIPDADVRAFEIVHRLLKPGGIAIISLPVVEPTSYWRDKITYFSKDRVALVTKNFEILDQRLVSKQTQEVKDAKIEYFQPSKEIGNLSVHLLTLKKPAAQPAH